MKIKEFLRITGTDYLYHRESQELEFKEQYSFFGLADYFKYLVAFAKNKGGYLIFGVTDAPRLPQMDHDVSSKHEPLSLTG